MFRGLRLLGLYSRQLARPDCSALPVPIKIEKRKEQGNVSEC